MIGVFVHTLRSGVNHEEGYLQLSCFKSTTSRYHSARRIDVLFETDTTRAQNCDKTANSHAVHCELSPTRGLQEQLNHRITRA